MALKKFRPKSPDYALGRNKGDTEYAKFGHLNALVSDVEINKANQETGRTSIPYEWYPDASVVSTGSKYKYTDGTTLYGYKIMGMCSLPFRYQTPLSDHLNEYLGTLVLTNGTMSGIFPGKISGMMTYYDGESNTVYGSPLSYSGYLWDNASGSRVLVEGITVNFYQYNQVNNEIWYAVVLQSEIAGEGVQLNGVINYEFEFSYPSNFNHSTFKIIQDNG